MQKELIISITPEQHGKKQHMNPSAPAPENLATFSLYEHLQQLNEQEEIKLQDLATIIGCSEAQVMELLGIDPLSAPPLKSITMSKLKMRLKNIIQLMSQSY